MTNRQLDHMWDGLTRSGTRIFSRAQIAAALIGAAIGAFLGVQAYYHGWLG